jgi:hypothetical protein
MKQKYLLIIVAGLAICLAGCLKEGHPVAVVGKWQEIKLRMYWDSAGTVKDDTTYLKPTFNALDYAQFNANGTCIIGTSHLYYEAGGYYSENGPYASTKTFNIAGSGSQFSLTQQNNAINPGGFVEMDTVSGYPKDTLMIHSVFYRALPINKTVSDALYVKQ